MATRVAGVLGYPVSHSISPALHAAAFAHHGLDAVYERWEVPSERLGERVASLRAPHCLGANVTIPHKEAVVSLLDDLAPEARAIGAVNTIVNREGRLTGHNTDAGGFVESLRREGGLDPVGRSIVLIGAGGAARAIAFGLAEAGAAAIHVFNRNAERAERLAEAVAAHYPGVALRGDALESPALRAAAERCDVLVNATSVGLHGDESPLSDDLIPSSALVVDIVYNPPRTRLLRAAEAKGARVLGGLPMLVYQAAGAFRLWTGLDAPVDRMFAAAREALRLEE
ncbi:MAG TPA: shikimate dehydrogenase [Chloroflexota bacterium]